MNYALHALHEDNLPLVLLRIFSRERDKLLLIRLIVFELVQALKFKTPVPDTNLVLLVHLVLQGKYSR